MDPRQQSARHTVAMELRASLQQHEAQTEKRIGEASTALHARVEAATQAGIDRINAAVAQIEARAEVLQRGFWGRLNWLITGR